MGGLLALSCLTALPQRPALAGQGEGAATRPSTQGVASCTPAEITTLARIYRQGNGSDAGKVLAKVVRDADKALEAGPKPVARIVTSGETVNSGERSNSGHASEQSSEAFALAMAYAATDVEAYRKGAKSYLLGWSRTNQPMGDSVAMTKFVPMIRAYDLTRDAFSPAERAVVDRWLAGIAGAIVDDQGLARRGGKSRGFNNHRSHALLVVGTIGCTIGDDRFVRYATDSGGFLDQVGENLRTVSREPEGLGYDYHQRKAFHYVAYNLQALGQLAVLIDRVRLLPGNPYQIDYNPFTVEVGQASILRTFRAFLPYAAGEKQSRDEFEGTTDSHDLIRIRSGALSRVFQRKDALPALEAAAYFFKTVEDPTTGHRYDIAAIVADILTEQKGRLTLPAGLPTPSILLDKVTSPYLGPGGR